MKLYAKGAESWKRGNDFTRIAKPKERPYECK